jgi:hypothetical protein
MIPRDCNIIIAKKINYLSQKSQTNTDFIGK